MAGESYSPWVERARNVSGREGSTIFERERFDASIVGFSGAIGGITFGSGAPSNTDYSSITRPPLGPEGLHRMRTLSAFELRMQFFPPRDRTRLFVLCLCAPHRTK